MDLKRMTIDELEAKIDSEGLKHMNCVSVLIMLDRFLGNKNSEYLHLATEEPEEVGIIELSQSITALNISTDIDFDKLTDFRSWLRQTEFELKVNLEVFKEELLNKLLEEKDQLIKWLVDEINSCRYDGEGYETLREVYFRFTGHDEV